MTIVFVHGNPETAAIWTPLFRELGRDDVVALSPPGFGAPVPEGFGATSDDYRDWLVRELAKFDAPVDLVGHDWGAGHVVRAVIARPDLVNRWCVDLGGCFDPDYVWHDAALGWQTEGVGESMIEAMAAVSVDQRTQGLIGMGMTPDAARSCAEAASSPDLGRCVLALYRSAAQPKMHEWGAQMTTAVSAGRSLVIIATEDHYTGGEVMARRTAERWGSAVATLPGLGHWWMMQDPAAGAKALRDFFS